MMKRTNFSTRPIVAAAAIALLGLTLGSAQAAVIDFSDDFNDTNADDFLLTGFDATQITMGGATVDVNNQAGFGDAGAQVELTNVDGKDIIMSTTISLSSFSGNSDIGFVAFSDTAAPLSGGYLADFKPSGAMRILEGPGFGDLTDGLGTFPFALNTTYTVTLRATPNGGQLDLTLSVFDAAGTTLLGSTSGTSTVVHTGNYFGYRANGGATTIVGALDDFSVTAIPEPSSLALVALGLIGMVSQRKRNRC
ncbi:MAG: PEP-CTERM sorting domain-containing protein [Planctomycetes bacterium]|nr:PEP-CTERM sorting domain-containing protein [Planctomycetota bacterium]